jgi:pyruvate formate lyase activating enzyme
MIKALVEGELVDYIALDYKAPKEKFQVLTKNKHFDHFSMTLNFLIKNKFPFEVRTTVHSDLLRVEEINRIIKDLVKRGYEGTYYLQPFVFTDNTIGRVKKEINPFDKSLLPNDFKIVWRL